MLIRGQRYLSKVEKSLRGLEKYAETTLKGLEKQERAHVDEIFTASEQIRDLLIELEALADKKMVLAQTGVMQAKSVSLWTLSVLMVCSVVLALVLGFSLSRNIAVPMQKAVSMIGEMELGHLQQRLNIDRDDEIGQMARSMDRFADSLQNEVVSSLEKLAKGDLTFEISPRDERDLLRGSLQKLGNDLNEIMTQVQVASDQIDSGSSQVSESAQSLSQGATQSAASVEEISSSMQEIGAQTNQSAENAQQANILAIAAAKAAKAGGDQMAEMVAAMDEINDSSQNISKIIKVIDEIAFQTN
ncbi:MAG: HAMP domain-containing protein, partial [Desulfuromonadales bacterium]|nr:HAMP domain-containing protein [Desulfuromonadales bacterium]